MTRYLISRIVQMIPPLFGLTLILFILLRIGGDPIAHLVDPEASAEEIAAVRAAYGFDRPLPEQYFRQLGLILTGDFGDSYRYKELALASIVIAIVIAIPAGLLSAVYQNTPLDLFVTTASTLGRAMPNFWIGIMLILIVGVQLRWLPVSGRFGFSSLVLPAITLGTGIATTIARVLRSSMLEVTVFGLQMAWLLGGSVIVEQVFAWPGMGRLMLNAVLQRDLTLVQAGVLVFALIVMVTNLLVDLTYAVLNPRIRYA